MTASMHSNPDGAWAARADELAAWTWKHLVNRTDVWGQYRRFSKRTEKTRKDGSTYTETAWTLPARKDRGKKQLTPAVLAAHYRGQSEGHIVGLHSTSPQN